uniref:cyclin-dependent kinase n=1 Tax=Phallusia mammillata TaxID=59560 RepID=A0A6F9D9N5_9ASCI|nr:cyclin-dependent kinase 11B-like [Phallusia mammillata]
MDAMEEGELVENEDRAASDTKQTTGVKRSQSMMEDEEEEVLDIKPPPVANKKHKRHHKKHKVKEEKKKKRHRSKSRSPNRDNKPPESRIASDIRTEADSQDRRSGDANDRLAPRKEYTSVRQIDRNPRNDPKLYPHERSKSYDYKSYERIPRSHSSRREGDSKRERDRSEMDRGSYSKSRDDKSRHTSSQSLSKIEDARARIERRREESRVSLIVRKYDEEKRHERRSKHDRTASDYTASSKSLHSLSSRSARHSDPTVDSHYRSRKERDEKSYTKRPESSTKPVEQKKASPQPSANEKKTTIAKSNEFVTEIVSSEDSSDSSDNSGSSSGEEGEDVDAAENEEAQPAAENEVGESDSSSDSSSSSEEEGSDDEDVSEEEEDVSDEVGVSEGEGSGSDSNEDSSDASEDGDPRSRFDSPVEKMEEVEESDVEDQQLENAFEGLVSPEPSPEKEPGLPFYFPAIQGCRSVDEFSCLNRIEEGTYGVVYRAKDKTKGTVVALKRLKMEKEREGFPITSLREVSTLLKASHPNIVRVQEIVVGSNVDKIYIVMDYVEHDLKSLMETMKQPFLVGEVKTLMIQFLRGVHHLHDNWILHRDLKTSNLLLSHKGILKIGDFGLAREYGSPLKPYTPIVVTLWYRSPELLLGAKEYACAVDMWSVGCIFAEFLSMKPLFPGKSEIMQLNLIFKELGTPSEKIWPGYDELPMVKKTTFTKHPYNTLRKRFGATDVSEQGFDLLNRFLTYCPEKRISALKALEHEWFHETPKPVEPSMFPTWPAKSEQSRQKKVANSSGGTPKAPEGGMGYSKLLNEEEKLGFQLTAPKHGISKHGTGFSLRF